MTTKPLETDAAAALAVLKEARSAGLVVHLNSPSPTAAPIFRLGIYAVNDLLRLFGSAEWVTVLQSRLRTGRPTSDTAQLGIKFASGAIANIFASFCIGDGTPYRNTMTINYENGTVYQNVGVFSPGSGSDADLQLVKPGPTGAAAVAAEAKFSVRSGRYDWRIFQRAVRGKKVDNELEPEEVVESLRVVAAMKEAAATGRVTKLR